MKYLLFIICLLFSFKTSYSTNLEENIDVCNSCHSAENIIEDPLVPSILGQEFFYIYSQLKDYKAGRRSHEVMSSIASELSKQDMKDIAQYYSEKKWSMFKSNLDYDSSTSDAIVSSGGRNACTKCHVGFKGNSGVPTIGGQKWTYLNETMKAFKDKKRNNAGQKIALFADLEYETIELLAKYLSDQ